MPALGGSLLFRLRGDTFPIEKPVTADQCFVAALARTISYLPVLRLHSSFPCHRSVRLGQAFEELARWLHQRLRDSCHFAFSFSVFRLIG